MGHSIDFILNHKNDPLRQAHMTCSKPVILKIDFRDRRAGGKGRGERQKHQFVVPLADAFDAESLCALTGG